MIKTFFISKNNFTNQEINSFKAEHGYEIDDVSYSSDVEIDFSNKEEKEFLLQNGVPKILARFGV